MCQLLGMNSSEPTDFTMNLKGFALRGGQTDIHSHGFGLCLYDDDDDIGDGTSNRNRENDNRERMRTITNINSDSDNDDDHGVVVGCSAAAAAATAAVGSGTSTTAGGGQLRSFHDTSPACKSSVVDWLLGRQKNDNPIRTHNMIAHIRYATQGEVTMNNVHPFIRTWNGIEVCFCHNGECPGFGTTTTRRQQPPLLSKTRACDRTTEVYRPVGETDSESVFCSILNALNAEFPPATQEKSSLPSLPVLYEFLDKICNEIVSVCLETATGSKNGVENNNNNNQETATIFNFLLGFGSYTLFAYSYPGRRIGSQVWNGLHYIIRQPSSSFTKANATTSSTTTQSNGDDDDDDPIVVVVITTKPLTEEKNWIEFRRDELIMFHKGIPYYGTRNMNQKIPQQRHKKEQLAALY